MFMAFLTCSVGSTSATQCHLRVHLFSPASIMGAAVIDDAASQSASPSLSSPQRVPWMAMLRNPMTSRWMPKRVANCRSQRLIFMRCTYPSPSSLFSRTHARHPERTEYRNSGRSPRRFSTRQSYRYPDEVVTAHRGPPLLVSAKTDR